MKNKILGFLTQKKNALNKMQGTPDKEGDRPGQFSGISEGIQKAAWIQETRTNEFGRLEARWGPGKYDWLVQIPSGKFMMGAVPQDKGAMGGEKPRHEVRITKPFWLMKYPVTQRQWVAVMGNNPSRFKGDDLPVEQVSWNDAKTYIGKLNEQAGKARFRLPTEAEWEYACRAGSTGKYCFGDNEAQLGKYAWYDNNSKGKTHTVGQKKPNAWGLYDLHGNVQEWIEDDYHNSYIDAPVDGRAWVDNPRGSYRILRGGWWVGDSGILQASKRTNYSLAITDYTVGFRCAQD